MCFNSLKGLAEVEKIAAKTVFKIIVADVVTCKII